MKHKWLCLPKAPTATRIYCGTKLLLLLIFLVIWVLEVAWTVITIRIYREQVAGATTRSQVQVFKTHSHFFLFTGLWTGAVILIGFWGILMEYIAVLLAYVFMTIGGLIFEIVGAIQSEDLTVLEYKAYGVAPQPILVLFAFIFMHMVRETEAKLAGMPLYRQTMAESRKSSFGEIENNNKKRSPRSSLPSNNNRLGQDNLALDIEEENLGQNKKALPFPQGCDGGDNSFHQETDQGKGASDVMTSPSMDVKGGS